MKLQRRAGKGHMAKRITLWEGAEIIGVTDSGLVDRHKGKPSDRRKHRRRSEWFVSSRSAFIGVHRRPFSFCAGVTKIKEGIAADERG